MNISVRYQSRGGNTKTVADAIAKAVGVIAEPIDTPVNEPIDLLIVGGGVYAWGLDTALKTWLKNLDTAKIKRIAAFTTAGGMDKTKDILEAAKAKGIPVCEETLAVKFLLKGHAFFGQAGKAKLNDNQIAAINEFAAKITS
ncbi:MAG: hypothetical protein LBT21_03770 [Oscillospiraceae bacterium]|nr:hypothetical protein [Oscillospiraceae bacterium]